ncbi:MAG: amino acid adenylation domain-containing protein, partial [Deltaproteobacteria bacterium]|nr:amino acid adenylation domain-containing protein [Deltaproteobacteria bacterium]
MNHVLQSILSLAHTTLGLKPDELDPDANILELGLDSLMIIKLAQEIERRFGVTLEARWFLTTMPSLADLARHVLDERPQHAVPMRAAEAPPEPRDGKGMPGPACTLPDLPPVGATHGPGLSALFEAQLRTMQTLFAEQLRALGGNLSPVPTPDATPNATPDTSRTDGPVRLERNIRGFVLEPTPLTDQQAAFVRELVARHTARTGKSNALGRRSGTLADWKSSLSFRPELRATAYPLVAESTFGGRFRDVDGNEYIDIALGMGVHFLGHNPPYVVEALRRRLERGFGLGPQCDLTAEAAERIRRLTGMERVSFCNTGSEAVMFALRLARAKTGRPLIALFNGAYHGTFDGVLAASEERGTGTYSPGTPLGMVEDVLVLDYNADSALDVLARRGNEIAAVLVEPVQSRKPGLQPQTFLRRLRRLTRERGICLIFDEMVNGFRRAPGGAQEHFGVRADMALYGKVAGGGLPVGIITGDKEYLDYIDGGFLGDAAQPSEGKTIVFGGTFCRHPLSMEGVVAATGYLLEQGPALQERVTRLTERLADRLNLWFQNERVPLRLMHFGPQFLFEGFGPYSAFAQPMELPLFYMLLLERGVYTWERRTCGLCTEHTEDDVRRIEEAIKDSVLALRAGGFAFSLDKGAPAFFTPMTPTEERLYAIFQREHGQDAYHLPLAWKIREQSAPLDVELLEISLGECIRRHEALRSSFHHLDDQLVRKVVDEPAFALERIDAEGRSTENILGAFVRPFDLERAPLMRAGLARLDDGYLFVLDLLHIAADGASLGILLDDLNALMNGQTPLAHSGPPRAALGATDQERVRADTDFWVERLADLPPLELPLDFPGKSGSPLGRREWMTLDAGLTARARAASRAFSVTMNMFLNGVYALLLHKLCGGTRFCVGMAEGGRHGEDMARVMGMFVNTVPQDFAVQPEWTLSGFMAAVRGACAESMDKNRAPYGDVAGRLGRSPAATMLSYEKADQRRPTWPGLEFTPLVPPGHGAMYDFAIDIVEMDGVLHCSLLSSEALRPETTRCFGQCFAHLVAETARLAEAPATLVGDVPALPPIQAEWILGPWQGATAPFDRSKTIVDLCREAARRHADKTALVFRDDRLTYADLDRASAVLARHLAASGAGRDKIVAVLVERGPEFVLAALGAMRAGAAYLPLDPKAPAERIAFQLGDAAPCALISPPGLRPEPRHFSGPWLDARALATLPEDDALPVPGDPGPDDLAYVIYTSGTTGQPKGVMVEHHGLANLCHWFARHYAVTEADRATAFAPFIFDASVWEIFPMLAQGAAVHILDDDTRHDLARLHDYLRREKITICYFLSQVAEMIDGASLPDLRLLLGGGEVLHRAVPAGAYRHCNTYGPTEFTVTATSFDLDGSWPVPIGRLVDNAQGLILDPVGRLQPVGVPGELCLAGEQLARGYLNRPELTATAFVANPLATQNSPHARMYRTGDLCRWRPDGNIEFLGRIDTQIKIRGHRVEPSEIEKTALTCPGVAQCAVMVRDETGTPLLCAYVVPATDAADTRSVRAHLAGLLPPYMVPDRIMLVDALPMGPSGKIDRKALPAPAAAEHASEPPRTAEERLLAEIWAEQLHVERVGRADNFFELGGDSIKALMVTSRIRAKGYALNARDIFRDATIADLAPRLTPYQATARQAKADTTTPSAPPADLEAIRAKLGAEVECVHGLSPLQHGIVFHGQLHPDSPAYLEQNLLTIRGPLDAETLARRLEVLTARHGMLRAAVIVRGVSRPWLAVLPPERVAPVLAREDLRGLIHAERQARLADIMRADRERGFDPQRPPLIRFTLLRTDEAEHALLCTVHHIIVDGWSMGVLFSELFGATAAATRPTQFRDFILWLESQDKNAALAWWRQRLAGAEPSEVPGHVPSEGEYRGRRTALPLPEGFEGRLRALAANTRLTVNTLLQAAWAVVLARCTMKDDVVFGEVVAGRPPELPGADGLIGLCANTVPVRARCEDGETFLDLAARLRDDGLTARQHAHCSLAEIQGAAGVGQDLLTHFFV